MGGNMGDFAAAAFDRATEDAWSGFRARLADHVAEMTEGDVLVVDTDPTDGVRDGAAPYVQFCGWGMSCVRAEVSSNAYLAAAYRLDDEAVRAVMDIGWTAPVPRRDAEEDAGSDNFVADAERVEADRLAVMSVRVLREVFGVVHPVFLAADGLEVDPAAPAPSDTAVEHADADEPMATMPRGRDELQALVDDALTPYFGHPPKKDSDGDIPVVTDSTVVYVRVLSDVPAVHLFCRLVREVSDVDAARFETGVLNRDGWFVKFTVVDDAVMAELDLPALPFAPEHLRDMLGVLCGRVDAVVEDLIERVGGVRELQEDDDCADGDQGDDAGPPSLVDLLADLDDEDVDDEGDELDDDPEADTDPIHPAMQTLLELDADRPGSITPEMAASVCSWDRELLLELISWNSSQEIAWRVARDRAADGDDAEEAAVCNGERAHAEGSVTLLRRALRLVVEAQVAKHRCSIGSAAAAGRGRNRGRTEGEDMSIAGLDVRAEQEQGLFEARPSWLEGGRS